jgi:hypothetical protein
MYKAKNINIRNNTARTSASFSEPFAKELKCLFAETERTNQRKPFQVEQSHDVQISLIDWLSEIKLKLTLQQETYFQAVELYLDTLKTFKHKLNNLDHQLIMITSLYLAIKYEEVEQINLDTVSSYISHNKFTNKQIVGCEILIMKQLRFKISRSHFPEFINKFFDVLFSYSLDSKDVTKAKSKIIEFSYLLYKLTLMDFDLTHNVKRKYLYLAIIYNALFLYTENDIDIFFNRILKILGVKREKVDEINKIIDRYFNVHIVNRKRCFILKEFDKLFENIN